MKNNFRIEIKALSEEGTFEGLLSVYNVVDGGGDLVEPGAFTKTIQEHGTEVPLLWQHKSDMPIGMLQLQDSAEGLRVKGSLLMELDDAKKAYLLIKAGIVKGLSIGYETIKKTVDGSVRRLKELRLFEGSLCTFPMNEMALVQSVKNKGERKDDFNEEFSEMQLQSATYQMMSALNESLCDIRCAPDLKPDEKLTASEETIQQFHTAYMVFLPMYLGMMADDEEDDASGNEMEVMARKARKEGRMLSSSTKDKIASAHGHIQQASDILLALQTVEAGTQSTSTFGAASKPEPEIKDAIVEPIAIVEDHSAAQSLIEQMRSLVQAA